jgi:hypothetical protein
VSSQPAVHTELEFGGNIWQMFSCLFSCRQCKY